MLVVEIYSGPRYVSRKVSSIGEARALRDEYKRERDEQLKSDPFSWSRWSCVCYDPDNVKWDFCGLLPEYRIDLD
jgi:hypothetical protein